MARPYLVPVTAVATALLLGACGGDSVEPEPRWEASGPRPAATLSATFADQSDALTIRYTLENTGAEPLIAYTGVPGEAASHAWDVYVTPGADGVVEIGKRTFAIPKGVDVDWVGEIKGATVPPGERVTEEFRVELPLRGRHPYRSEVKLPDPVRRVSFCLGVLAQSQAPAPVVTPKPSGDTRPGYPANGPQHLFCSQPHDLPH